MSESLAARLWTYQAERFPLFKTALLVLFFTAATICVSATLADRTLPHWTVFAGVWFCVVILFFQMRVADEFKDYEVDSKYRPERAVPRGLVTRRLLAWLAVLFGGLALCVTGLISLKLIWPLLAVWLWLGLMSFEFFVPKWLKSRPLIYLISHMAIMPLIDFYVSAAEWLDHGDKPGVGLYLFYGLSFLNGCVLEFGRKIWAPENERDGLFGQLWSQTRRDGMGTCLCFGRHHVNFGLLFSGHINLGNCADDFDFRGAFETGF